MKKLIIASLIVLSTGAFAQHYGHGGHYKWQHRHHGHYSGGGGWVAPLIIGGVVGAVIAREQQAQAQSSVIIQRPPSVVVLNPPQTVYTERQPVCTEWREIQNSDGVIYRERTCTQ